MSIDSIQSSNPSSIAMETSISIAKKSQDFTKAQGQAALQLIDSATSVASVSGANASARGTGTILDLLA